MKKHYRALVLALPLSVLLNGCVIAVGDTDGSVHASWQKAEKENRDKIASLALGQPLASVRERMGQPDFSESYREDGQDVLVLFYRTQRQDSDGTTTKDECTPLVFKSGLLTGWGDTVYAQVGGHPAR